jgi:hypothetical protein
MSILDFNPSTLRSKRTNVVDRNLAKPNSAQALLSFNGRHAAIENASKTPSVLHHVASSHFVNCRRCAAPAVQNPGSLLRFLWDLRRVYGGFRRVYVQFT